MNEQTIKISKDKKFLSEQFKFIPSNCLLNKGITGCGGTTVEINSNRNSIICVPNISLVLNKQNNNLFGVYGKTSIADIKLYLRKNKSYNKFIVVYDSLSKLIEVIGESVYKDYFLLIDEYHILFNSYVLRNVAVKKLLNIYNRFDNFCFMTATPLDDSTILKELVGLPIIKLEWENSSKVDITIEDTFYVSSRVSEQIKFCLQNDYNLHIFINSMKSISKIVRGLGLSDYKIVCSEDSANKYKTLNCVNVVTDIKKINFYTSACFEGVDIYDPVGKTIVISDSNISTTMMDISTLFIQICGRLRDSIYKNKITFIVNTKTHRYCRYNNKQEFEVDSNEFERLGKITEDLFIKGNSDYKKKERITYSYDTYTNLYVIKDEEDNLLYDENLKKVDLKNFDIVHNIYASEYSVIDNVNETNKLQVTKVINKYTDYQDRLNMIQERFDYSKMYLYVEIVDNLKSALKDFGIVFKKNEIKKYINMKEKQVYKDGKRIRLYELIK